MPAAAGICLFINILLFEPGNVDPKRCRRIFVYSQIALVCRQVFDGHLRDISAFCQDSDSLLAG